MVRTLEDFGLSVTLINAAWLVGLLLEIKINSFLGKWVTLLKLKVYTAKQVGNK